MEEKVVKETCKDEIDLYELLLVLKKRAKLIGAVVFASVVIATIAVFLMPNIYQARATVWVDSFLTLALIQSLQTVQSTEPKNVFLSLPNSPPNANNLALSILNSIEFKKNVLKILESSYGSLKKIGLDNIDEEDLEKILQSKVDPKTQSIMITAIHQDKKIAKDIVSAAVEELDRELKRVSENYKTTFIKNPDKNREYNFFVLNVIEKPTYFDQPVKPKRRLIIAVSAVSALFVGMFLAFILEWWDNAKRTRAKGNN
ncbi:YveK family protein [Thermodesulfobacterium thermophilum]|uniref:YveK family protein n=1 Tax=Thermodesulfobacterium thermophilum TaxID=886 RepID=UPI0003B349FD|nr:Wzz/FepE/Etk N-terminal domain-containing protein [Thermodesulfobacterium thermophilum]